VRTTAALRLGDYRQFDRRLRGRAGRQHAHQHRDNASAMTRVEYFLIGVVVVMIVIITYCLFAAS
jgi:hypothetical protein